jgi:CubicO group peptidase (beta-lactamase class C family)
LANGGELNGVRILRPDTIQAMFSPHVAVEGLGPTMPFGYGFSIADEAVAESGMAPANTVGWSGSGNTFFWLDPETRDAVIFMTQVIVTPPHYDVARQFRVQTNDIAATLQ